MDKTHTLKLTRVRSHEKSCVGTRFLGRKVTHDKSGFYMIFHVNLHEFLGLDITIFRVIYMKFHAISHVESHDTHMPLLELFDKKYGIIRYYFDKLLGNIGVYLQNWYILVLDKLS